MRPTTHPAEPFEHVEADIVGPYRFDEDQQSILAVRCRFTRAVVLRPLPAMIDGQSPTGAQAVARAFVDGVVMRYGCPRTLRTDRGSQFRSEFFRQVTELLGTTLDYAPAYDHNPTGGVERSFRTLNQMIRIYSERGGRLCHRLLPSLETAINSAKHASTGETPFFLCHGYDYRPPATAMARDGEDTERLDFENDEQLRTALNNYATETRAALRFANATAAVLDDIATEQTAERYNDRHRPTTYDYGQRVWVYTPPQSTPTRSAKTMPLWSGPRTTLGRDVNTGNEVLALWNGDNDLVPAWRLRPYTERASYPRLVPTPDGGDRPMTDAEIAGALVGALDKGRAPEPRERRNTVPEQPSLANRL
jgi:hypothetical protein